jgi:hypothetical protein
LLVYSLGTGDATEPSATVIGVAEVVGGWGKSGRNWRAYATVKVRDVSDVNNIEGALMANVAVTGSFSPGGNTSCVTAGNGTCRLASAPIIGTDRTNFTIGNLTGPDMTWDGATPGIIILKP